MYIEQIENELKQLVSVLERVIPALEEVRVFGSYENGNWNPDRSDIDIFVLTNDENFYSKKDTQFVLSDYTEHESKQRKKLRKLILENFSGNYKDKLSLHIYTPTDVEDVQGVDEGKGDLGKNIKNGRLLYSK
ncbi:MAG: nucleotidyltransferase domain-containing protein [Nanoarchaeota archaeon]|nr:nucleotidyltransferase domain-containing protein [Nanoarchaeota archaeon]MBU2519799.1 nucleotidyltransferase domain-containing protein [Nanoarchaeota archaeon]